MSFERMMKPLLQVSDLTKIFGALPVLNGISFSVNAGEVIGLAGGSGSGKSVLAMLLAGLDTPTSGQIYFEGKRVLWPIHAHRFGIEVIHQTPVLVDSLDVTSNIFLGNELGWPPRLGWLRIPDWRGMENEANQILDTLDLTGISLREKVSNLSSEQRQMIAIGRVMTRPVKLLVIDEPMTLLRYSYQQKLLSLIGAWQNEGIAVIFSSNNLDHLFSVTDRLILLSEGRIAVEKNTDETTPEEMVTKLVGTPNDKQMTPTIWAVDSYFRVREKAEVLSHTKTLLEKDLAAQGSLNQQLIQQLAVQFEALNKANRALQQTHGQVLSEREQERKHLARELHDDVIQDLLSLSYQLEDFCESGNFQESENKEIIDIRQSIQKMITDLRHICRDLRPPTIDNLGLGPAIQSFLQDWSERTSIPVNINLPQNINRLPESTELSIFRIVQEGMSNIRKHARATAVDVCIEQATPRMLKLSILDNGIGISKGSNLATANTSGKYGLLGISERVTLLGGRFKISNEPQGGVSLEVEIPCPRV